jgi:hypothetical protein
MYIPGYSGTHLDIPGHTWTFLDIPGFLGRLDLRQQCELLYIISNLAICRNRHVMLIWGACPSLIWIFSVAMYVVSLKYTGKYIHMNNTYTYCYFS